MPRFPVGGRDGFRNRASAIGSGRVPSSLSPPLFVTIVLPLHSRPDWSELLPDVRKDSVGNGSLVTGN